MRLLNTDGELKIQSFVNAINLDPYAILSHTWMSEGEVTFEDLANHDVARSKPGWDKVTEARRQAKEDGLDWIWIDTCCIDKSSSTELGEAINSMFRYYRNSAKCYVHLDDMPDRAGCGATPVEDRAEIADTEPLTAPSDFDVHSFKKCRWFTRGWTLQEMLAPPPQNVTLFSATWQVIGSLPDLAEEIASITGVSTRLLREHREANTDFRQYSIAEKMFWAASRKTTRDEDIAYCLLGIFDVNMTINYGEGMAAFFRLQEAIMKATPEDQSILVWHRGDSSTELFAPSPYKFKHSGDVVPLATFPGQEQTKRYHEVVSSGIQIDLPFRRSCSSLDHDSYNHPLAVLRCRMRNDDCTIALALKLDDRGIRPNFVIRGVVPIDSYFAAYMELPTAPLSILFSKKSTIFPHSQFDQLSETTGLGVSKLVLRLIKGTMADLSDVPWPNGQRRTTQHPRCHGRTYTISSADDQPNFDISICEEWQKCNISARVKFGTEPSSDTRLLSTEVKISAMSNTLIGRISALFPDSQRAKRFRVQMQEGLNTDPPADYLHKRIFVQTTRWLPIFYVIQARIRPATLLGENIILVEVSKIEAVRVTVLARGWYATKDWRFKPVAPVLCVTMPLYIVVTCISISDRSPALIAFIVLCFLAFICFVLKIQSEVYAAHELSEAWDSVLVTKVPHAFWRIFVYCAVQIQRFWRHWVSER